MLLPPYRGGHGGQESLNDLPSKWQSGDSAWGCGPQTGLQRGHLPPPWQKAGDSPTTELFPFKDMLQAEDISIFNTLIEV